MGKQRANSASTVKLYSPELDETREHDLEHANRIFAMKHNHGWELNDTNYELKDGTITKRDSKKAQGADQQETA